MRFAPFLTAALASVATAAPSLTGKPAQERGLQTIHRRAPTSVERAMRAAEMKSTAVSTRGVSPRQGLVNVTEDQFTPNTFENWRTFKANGVNLGDWFVLEPVIDPSFFTDNGVGDALDEYTFCKDLGLCKCGQLLEERYATWFTTQDVDMFADYGINLLRIPLGYWAFIKPVNGDYYHHGRQLYYAAQLANYAIEKGMHIIIDLHGLPGGQNGLDNCGRTDALDWWYNSTNMEYSLQVVDKATEFILNQPHPEQYTLALINEPLPFGLATDISNITAPQYEYVNEYYHQAINVVRQKDTNHAIPIMLTDCLNGPADWAPYWNGSEDPNLVWDTHMYFWYGADYPQSAPYSACYLAKLYTNFTIPVLVGEWSLLASFYNTADDQTRSEFFYSQRDAYLKYLQGGSFWNGKWVSDLIVGTDNSTQPEFWSFQLLAQEDIIKLPGEPYQAVTC
ncbi:glycoside hydrolase superfamily [Xylariales sp. PMI_506]|nr:glycoside hydrolase superfamily [Xylariales sp. PMI_506]